MLVSDFDYDLPPELIAQQPPAERSGARLLEVDRFTGEWCDRSFLEFPELLQAGDVLVLNDSRVIPARLFGQRMAKDGGASAGRIEALLTEQTGEWEWRALVRPGRKILVGSSLLFSSPDDKTFRLQAEVLSHGEFGERLLRFAPCEDFFAALNRIGHMPLPPYIHRPDDGEDRQRYQTVFSRRPGSAAAPTAGLHFTPEILERVRARGVTVVFVTLHVGLGTFQPLRVTQVADIQLHRENYTLPEATASAVNTALTEGRRVIAVGTTTVRTLEHCALAAAGSPLKAHSGATNIFISPGYRFAVISGMLTNFHLPQSTLVMLVSAFAGRESVLRAYRHAVDEKYRFFSYGDCMFLCGRTRAV